MKPSMRIHMNTLGSSNSRKNFIKRRCEKHGETLYLDQQYNRTFQKVPIYKRQKIHLIPPIFIYGKIITVFLTKANIFSFVFPH